MKLREVKDQIGLLTDQDFIACVLRYKVSRKVKNMPFKCKRVPFEVVR